MIIPAPKALTIARHYFNGILQHEDSLMINPWREAELGNPILVRTVESKASFWMVPVEHPGQALGYINIGPDGQVMGYAYLYENPADLFACPPLATRISAEEARELANDLLKAYKAAEFSTPVFVHDGPHSRLAWMIEIRMASKLISRVFVTPGYSYEQKTGDKPSPPGLRG